MFECPVYADLRQASCLHSHFSIEDPTLCCIHQNQCTWKQLKQLRSFYANVLTCRAALAGGEGKVGWLSLETRVDLAWLNDSILLARPE